MATTFCENDFSVRDLFENQTECQSIYAIMITAIVHLIFEFVLFGLCFHWLFIKERREIFERLHRPFEFHVSHLTIMVLFLRTLFAIPSKMIMAIAQTTPADRHTTELGIVSTVLVAATWYTECLWASQVFFGQYKVVVGVTKKVVHIEAISFRSVKIACAIWNVAWLILVPLAYGLSWNADLGLAFWSLDIGLVAGLPCALAMLSFWAWYKLAKLTKDTAHDQHSAQQKFKVWGFFLVIAVPINVAFFLAAIFVPWLKAHQWVVYLLGEITVECGGYILFYMFSSAKFHHATKTSEMTSHGHHSGSGSASATGVNTVKLNTSNGNGNSISTNSAREEIEVARDVNAIRDS